MKLLPRILNRVVFVRAQEGVSSVFVWKQEALMEADWGAAAAKGALVALVVCGQGVVTKPDGAPIVQRIQADPATFLWSSALGRTSFVRREQLQTTYAELDTHSVVAVQTFCADAAVDLEAAVEEYVRQLYDSLKWKALLKPTEQSSAVAQAVLRRLALPVLGAFLALLAANAMLSPKLNSRRQALQTELDTRERTASGAASADARQRALLAEFAVAPAVSRAVLCDRIADAVPERVTLTALEVEPLVKRFEAGKPLQRNEGTVVVSGTAISAADVSEFVRRLTSEEVCRDVRLTGVEKQRDNDLLSFRIESAI